MDQCIYPPCSAEGVDSSIIGWATDILISLVALLFATALCCVARGAVTRRVPAVGTFLGKSVAFGLGGLAHAVLANRASDGCGMAGFYVAWAVSYFALGLSQGCWLAFAKEAASGSGLRCGYLLALRCVGVGIAFFTLLIVVGCSWCLSSTHIWADIGVHDVCDDEPATCDNVVALGEVCFTVFWVAGMAVGVAILLHVEQVRGDVWSRVPLLVAVCLTFTFGPMLFIYLLVYTTVAGLDPARAYADIHGALIFHVATLGILACLFGPMFRGERVKRLLAMSEHAAIPASIAVDVAL